MKWNNEVRKNSVKICSDRGPTLKSNWLESTFKKTCNWRFLESLTGLWRKSRWKTEQEVIGKVRCNRISIVLLSYSKFWANTCQLNSSLFKNDSWQTINIQLSPNDKQFSWRATMFNVDRQSYWQKFLASPFDILNWKSVKTWKRLWRQDFSLSSSLPFQLVRWNFQ